MLGPLQISIVRVSWGPFELHPRSETEELSWHHFPQHDSEDRFIAGEWPAYSDIPCYNQVMAIPLGRLEPAGQNHMPVLKLVTERRVMENGAIVDLVDFQAPEIKL